MFPDAPSLLTADPPAWLDAVSVRGLDHLALAVPTLDEGRALYERLLGGLWQGSEDVPEQRVRAGFISLGSGDQRIVLELLEPLDDQAPLHRFLRDRGPGLHHVAYEVDDLPTSLNRLARAGVRLIDETPRRGAHNRHIAFIHPKSCGGVLVELCSRVESYSF